MAPQEIREAFPPDRRPAVITAQLQAAKLTRAVLSERQLEEVMVDFWLNHFNVYALQGAGALDGARLRAPGPPPARARPVPRPRGRHRAASRHALLPRQLAEHARATSSLSPARGGRKLGLNENYARELMELHTLGVDGGYTQEDVIEVARCFTGWTIDRPQRGRRIPLPSPAPTTAARSACWAR